MIGVGDSSPMSRYWVRELEGWRRPGVSMRWEIPPPPPPHILYLHSLSKVSRFKNRYLQNILSWRNHFYHQRLTIRAVPQCCWRRGNRSSFRSSNNSRQFRPDSRLYLHHSYTLIYHLENHSWYDIGNVLDKLQWNSYFFMVRSHFCHKLIYVWCM